VGGGILAKGKRLERQDLAPRAGHELDGRWDGALSCALSGKTGTRLRAFTPSDPDALRATLRPCDVLLVEGNNHISGVIKYLTQSTWSHAALYVGPIGDRVTADGEPLVLVEANIGHGVVASKITRLESEAARQEILEIRHSSLYAPRDFDISPYFEVVKPTLVHGFDYKAVAWADQPTAENVPLVPAEDDMLSPVS